MRVLLTNDDGIEAEGLQALRRALLELAGVELAVIAPDGNRSATARSITTRRPLWVEEVDFGDGTVGYATDGTPVDCVRLADARPGRRLPARAGRLRHQPRLEPRRRHHLLGHGGRGARGPHARPARRSPSRSSPRGREWTSASASGFDFDAAGAPSRRALRRASSTTVPLPAGTLLNVNVPAGAAAGVAVTRIGKRIYRDELQLDSEDDGGRRRYWIYGEDPGFRDEEGTDIEAVRAGRIAVTPVHFDLTDAAGMDALRALRPRAARAARRPGGGVSATAGEGRPPRGGAAGGARRARAPLLRPRRPDDRATTSTTRCYAELKGLEDEHPELRHARLADAARRRHADQPR